MKNRRYLFLAFLLFTNNVLSHSFTGVPPKGNGSTSPAMQRPPLAFIENNGQITDQNHQARNDIYFMMPAANGLNIFLGKSRIEYQFKTMSGKTSGSGLSGISVAGNPEAEPVKYSYSRMDVELVGANKNARIIREQATDYYERYFTTDLNGTTAHSFTRVIYKDIYPHIDWVLYAANSQLKQEFIVRKGGKVSNIKLKYTGCRSLELNADGSLIASTAQGAITENAPYSYQSDGKKIISSFKLRNNMLSYETGKYDGDLVIDPSLLWATYYGGANDEQGASVVTDNAGNVYMAGTTSSSSAIATSGASQGSFAGGNYDNFIVKFDSTGARQWATYYGGTGDDGGGILALDGAGNVYMTGFTTSTAGIATSGAFQNAHGGGLYDAFLAKFNGAGTLKWATYFGGNGKEFGWGLVADTSGNVYMGGQTGTVTGIASPGAYQDTIGDLVGATPDAFLAKFDSAGNRLWSTYYGSDDGDFGHKICLDILGNVYMTGITMSFTGMSTTGAYQALNYGSYDAFLVKFTSSCVQKWGTYFGGINEDQATTVATDHHGNVYIAGFTNSATNIASASAFQQFAGGTAPGQYDGFLAKFDSAGAIRWSTYYGKDSSDFAYSVAIDDSDNVLMAGTTSSTAGMTTPGTWQEFYLGGSSDGFLVKFDSAGARKWCTYYGGTNTDQVTGMTMDRTANIYLTGNTLSTAGIASTGAFQDVFGGGSNFGDAFLAKLSPRDGLGVNTIQASAAQIASIFPNPTAGDLAIDVTDGGTLTVYSLTGLTVGNYQLAKGTTKIQLPPNLAAGAYLCNYKCANGSQQNTRLMVMPHN